MVKHHPPIVVISGPIGSGKGTIIHALVHELDLHWVPTHTTRAMRRDDDALSHRVFDTETNFARHLARGEFIESVEKGGHHYGLLRADLEKELHMNHPVIIDIDVAGGMKVAQEFPETFLIFIMTDEKVRRSRVLHRGMDSQELERRMKEAAHEEKLAHQNYHYLVENIEDHPEEAIDTIKRLIIERFPSLGEGEEESHVEQKILE